MTRNPDAQKERLLGAGARARARRSNTSEHLKRRPFQRAFLVSWDDPGRRPPVVSGVKCPKTRHFATKTRAREGGAPGASRPLARWPSPGTSDPGADRRACGRHRRTLLRWQQQEPAFAARWRELAALEDARLKAEAERAQTRRIRRMSEVSHRLPRTISGRSSPGRCPRRVSVAFRARHRRQALAASAICPKWPCCCGTMI